MTNRAATDAWDEHWTAYAKTNALNPAQVERQKLIFGALRLDEAPSPVRLLDLGSGSGELSSAVLVARPDADVVGLDLARTAVEIAQRKVPTARFFQSDFAKPMALPAQLDGWATHAVCSEVLEHLDAPGAMLRNIRRYLAPGARLVITVPAGPMSAFDKHIGHRRHFDRRSLAGLLQGSGFRDVVVHGAGFPFFNLYRLAVVARGEALVKDAVAQGDGADLPLLARATVRAFSLLFKLNMPKLDLGWQLVAVASV
jgi:2-polyprenyl-3-methyl-5-hydroxy-6-metoxy-1,4-benzoquinol methylase